MRKLSNRAVSARFKNTALINHKNLSNQFYPIAQYIFYIFKYTGCSKKLNRKNYLKSPGQTVHCAIRDRGYHISGINPIMAKICQNFSPASKYIIVFGIFEPDYPLKSQKEVYFLWVTRYIAKIVQGAQ